nr:NHL repeat-containing protein [Ipomoea batatas]
MGIPVALRLHCLKEIHRLLPLNHAGKSYQLLGGAGSLVPLCLSSSLQKSIGSIGKHDYKSCDYRRYSTISKSKQESLPHHDLLSFIQSTINKHEGPSHCWLNGIALKKNFFKKEGITLVIVAEFFQGSSLPQHDLFIMLDKVKLLQQRYPFLPVMGYQYSTSPLLSKDDHTHLLRRVMKEYITFPILLSNKNFPKITGGTCCIIFRGLKSPIIYQGKEVDSMILDNVIKDLNVQDRKTANFMHNMNSPWEKPLEVFEEPYLCFPFRNLFLYFPGCISVDEKGNRVFVSDSNHHRIIVFDANGEILDSIGSSPGFEDGDFESAKLMRPAAFFYHAADNCLYIADSENHAIRRADMERRILDTLYPATNSNKDSNRLWSWIFGKLWSRKDIEAKSDEFPPKTLLFPWHISKCQNDLFVLNCNLQTLWILDLASGALQEIVKGMEATAKALHYLLLVTISSTSFYTLKDSRIYRRSVGILYWRSQIFLNKYQMIC